MPVFVINLISTLIYRPILTKLASHWNNNEVDDLRKKVIKQLLLIVFLTILAVVFAYYLGTIVLGYIYKVDLSSFRLSLSLLMIGGGLNALVGYFLSIVTIIRSQKDIIVGYIVVSLIALLLSNYVVREYNILGAAMLYDILTLLLALYFVIIFMIRFKKNNKKAK